MMRISLFLLTLCISVSQAQPVTDGCLLVRYSCFFNEDFDRGSYPVPYQARLYAWANHSYFVSVRDPAAPKMSSAASADLQPDTLWRTAKWMDEETAVFGAFSFEGKEVFYRDSLHPMAWTLHKETRKIDSLDCMKATAAFRGRMYTAWYAPSIPSPNGPWKLGGLPGLIIEAYDEKKDLLFRVQSISKIQPDKLYRDLGPHARYDTYQTYVAYLKKSIRQIEDMIAAQRQENCLDCQTNSKVTIYLWEMLEK